MGGRTSFGRQSDTMEYLCGLQAIFNIKRIRSPLVVPRQNQVRTALERFLTVKTIVEARLNLNSAQLIRPDSRCVLFGITHSWQDW